MALAYSGRAITGFTLETPLRLFLIGRRNESIDYACFVSLTIRDPAFGALVKISAAGDPRHGAMSFQRRQ